MSFIEAPSSISSSGTSVPTNPNNIDDDTATKADLDTNQTSPGADTSQAIANFTGSLYADRDKQIVIRSGGAVQVFTGSGLDEGIAAIDVQYSVNGGSGYTAVAAQSLVVQEDGGTDDSDSYANRTDIITILAADGIALDQIKVKFYAHATVVAEPDSVTCTANLNAYAAYVIIKDVGGVAGFFNV